MKSTLLFTLLLVAAMSLQAQKYFTRDGYIRFFSSTSMEDIEAENKKVTTVMDGATGKLEFSALMKSFEFEKALMEEHFNENYVESNTYPKATFKGEIVDFKKGSYASATPVKVKGKMKIHGVEKDVTIDGTAHETKDGYTLKSSFVVNPEDYDIEIPNAVRDNIAKEIEVTVEADLVPLKK